MAKKRTTLPSGLYTIIENQDLNAFKAIFDKCDINAYERGYSKTPALLFYSLPIEFAEWLLDNGANIHITDTYGDTALHRHNNNIALLKLLLRHGADISAQNNKDNTPLHCAEGNTVAVQFFLENGANPLTTNHLGLTPLQYMLSRCNNIDITEMANIAELLLNAGDTVNEFCQEKVKEIGKNFEFHRANFNPEYLDETQAGLNKLYHLFNVTPITKRIMHDGISPIIAQGETLNEQFEYLWQFLIPSQGKADTVQGELIRIVGKIQDEIYRNGSGNWNKNHKQMLSSFVQYLSLGNIEQHYIENAEHAKKALYNGDDDDQAMDHLIEIAVLWVQQNSNPIPLEKVDYSI